MAIQDSDILKSYWSLGKVPTPSNYDDLIDTIFAQGSNGPFGQHNHDDRYVQLSIANTGSVWMGAGPLTERLSFDLTNGLQIFNHANSAVLQFPTSGGGNIVGTLSISNGSILAGSNSVIIDDNGISLDATLGKYGSSTINWWDGNQRELSIGVEVDLGEPMASYFDSYHGFQFTINADNETFLVAFVGSGSSSRFRVSNGDIWSAYDIRVGYGLYVGDSSLNTNPGDGEIIATNRMYINDTSNSKSTMGLTINQSSNDDEILALKSSDVAHGMTDITETDTYGLFRKNNADNGGLRIQGFKDTTGGAALVLAASDYADATGKETYSIGSVTLFANKANGTTYQDLGADANILVLRNNATALFFFDSDGDFAYSGNLQTRKNSTLYTGYIFVPLDTPLTSTSWDGDTYSTVGTSTLIDLSSVFGVPAGVKAILVQMIASESATFPTGGLYFAIGPTSASWWSSVVRPLGGSYATEQDSVVPCNSDGDIYYRINASGTNTMAITFKIYGYWI